MPTDRKPAEVIRRLLEEIPGTELELRAQLEQLAQDAWFYPPEGKHVVWSQLQYLLERRFGDGRPGDGWPMIVSEIVRGVRS